jgi:hypothetical protein
LAIGNSVAALARAYGAVTEADAVERIEAGLDLAAPAALRAIEAQERARLATLFGGAGRLT